MLLLSALALLVLEPALGSDLILCFVLPFFTLPSPKEVDLGLVSKSSEERFKLLRTDDRVATISGGYFGASRRRTEGRVLGRCFVRIGCCVSQVFEVTE